MEEKTLSSKSIYQGKIINLRVDEVLLSNQKKAIREIIVHGSVIAVIPVLANGNIVMVRQYRKPAEAVTLEIPAGRVDDGEELEKAVARELREETGYAATDIHHILDFYPAIGYSTENIALYLARGLSPGEIDPDEDEIIETESYSLEELLKFIQEGKIIDSKSLVGILYYANTLDHSSSSD